MAEVVKNKERKLIRRPPEERLAEIDKKIAFHQNSIKNLEAKKQTILHPKRRKSKAATMKALILKAKETGLTNKEIAERLGISLDFDLDDFVTENESSTDISTDADTPAEDKE